MKASTKITHKQQINRALWVMVCPKCHSVCASAMEPQYLPEFTTCECLGDMPTKVEPDLPIKYVVEPETTNFREHIRVELYAKVRGYLIEKRGWTICMPEFEVPGTLTHKTVTTLEEAKALIQERLKQEYK